MSLHSKWIQYGDEQKHSGFLVLPDGPSPLEKPAVIVIQEIWGVDSHIQDITERFAKAGFIAFAPELFHREGVKVPELEQGRIAEAKRFLDTIPPSAWRDPEVRGQALRALPGTQGREIGETLEKIFSAGANAAAYVEQLVASAQFLREHESGSRRRAVAAVGFCLGGMLSAQLALHDAELRGAIIFYGNLPAADQVPQLHCPLLGFFGELDARITDQVPAFAAAMEQHGKAFDYRIYEGAPHAFANDSRPSYRAEAAQDAFAKSLTFLREQLTT